jgi:PhnB protein
MGSDTSESWGPPTIQGNNFSVSVNADGRDDADRIFNGLSAGGRVTMPMQNMFWGAYFGMFTDKFGIQWMVNYEYGPHT